MQPLLGQKVLLGVSGGIASYKSAYLARRLIEAGAEVRVVMTRGAQAFIAPLSFQALTGNPIHTDLLDPAAEAAMGHIELARWADAILIAPASANTLARLSHGLADDLLATLCLASAAPVFLAPAMNRLMWAHPATQANARLLGERGVTLFGPADGEQACGETGAGRMLEPDELCQALIEHLITGAAQHPDKSGTPAQAASDDPSPLDAVTTATSNDAPHDASLANRHIVITAGPTREPIDPVRYISNHSSGKMGYALAAAAVALQARVTLISGPVNLNTPEGVERTDVDSARSMQAAVQQAIVDADIFISVAAVADYRLAEIKEQKIKKSGDTLTLSMVRNPDILAGVAGAEKRPFCVGFAAETERLEQHARGKLERKHLDMIAANRVGGADDPVFGSDRNQLEVFWPGGGHQRIESASKTVVAAQLLNLVAERFNASQTSGPTSGPTTSSSTGPSVS